MASTHQCCSLLTRLFLALCNLYCTGNTHHCLGQLTRLFLALRAFYCTGKHAPMPLSTHEVISCSASFMAAVAFSVTLKSSRLGGLTSAAGKLPWTSFPLVTEDGNHDTKATIHVFLRMLQVRCHGHPSFWSHKTAIMNHDTKASIQVFLQMLQVSCHGHPSFWSHETAIMTPRHSYRCFYN